MTVRVYRYDDASAPALNGTAGSLIGVLRACLVEGYGVQTAAGWSMPFGPASNVAVFRNGTGSSQSYFRVVDDGSIATAGAREAQVWIYSDMTSISAGSNVSPSANTNNAIRKSASADATSRPWKIIASEKAVHLFIACADVDSMWAWHAFGDYQAYNAPYNFNTAFLVARAVNSSQHLSLATSSTTLNTAVNQVPGAVPAVSANYHVLLHDGTGYDKRFSAVPGNTIHPVDASATNGYTLYTTNLRYIGVSFANNYFYSSMGGGANNNMLMPATGSVMRNSATSMIPVQVFSYSGSWANAAFLGVLPGMYESCARGHSDGQTASFSNYPGRTFTKVELSGGSFAGVSPGFYIETTSTATW